MGCKCYGSTLPVRQVEEKVRVLQGPLELLLSSYSKAALTSYCQEDLRSSVGGASNGRQERIRGSSLK